MKDNDRWHGYAQALFRAYARSAYLRGETPEDHAASVLRAVAAVRPKEPVAPLPYQEVLRGFVSHMRACVVPANTIAAILLQAACAWLGGNDSVTRDIMDIKEPPCPKDS